MAQPVAPAHVQHPTFSWELGIMMQTETEISNIRQ